MEQEQEQARIEEVKSMPEREHEENISIERVT
jgi:hypothetical protein